MSILQDIIPASISLGGLNCVKGLGTIPILTKEVPEIPVLEPLELALEKGVASAPDLNGTSIEAAKEWWDTIFKTPFTQHDSPAAGEDIRVGTEDVIGSGLIWHDVVVHFSCFPNVRVENGRPSQSRALADQRRRNLRSSMSD